MATCVRCAFSDNMHDFASMAAMWISGFHPQIRATLGSGTVDLQSDHHDTEALTAIWTAALANEQLLKLGAEHRAAAFAALTQ
jgi:hypothetical protein